MSAMEVPKCPPRPLPDQLHPTPKPTYSDNYLCYRPTTTQDPSSPTYSGPALLGPCTHRMPICSQTTQTIWTLSHKSMSPALCTQTQARVAAQSPTCSSGTSFRNSRGRRSVQKASSGTVSRARSNCGRGQGAPVGLSAGTSKNYTRG